MKKKMIMALLKAKTRAKQAAHNNDGGVLAEHGLLIAGVAAIIFILIPLLINFIDDQFLPSMFNRIMDIFNLT